MGSLEMCPGFSAVLHNFAKVIRRKYHYLKRFDDESTQRKYTIIDHDYYVWQNHIMTDKARTVIQFYGWDKKRVKECERAFRHFDKDGDGAIDSTEVIEVMRCAGQNPTLKMVDEMMAEADESGDGVIDFAEFITLMHKYQETDTEAELRQAFRVFDRDNSGSISRDELKTIMTKLGDEPVSDDVLDEMIQEADLNGDGVIQYEEFLAIMRKLMEEESDEEDEAHAQACARSRRK